MKTDDPKLPQHVHGHLHVTGSSHFIGDEFPTETLYAKAVSSTFAHARFTIQSTNAAQNLPGVIAILTAKDIPGENQIGHVLRDEPLLPIDEVCYIGQPIALVVATSEWIAKQAAAAIQVDYEPLKPLLNIDDAIAERSFYFPEQVNARGDIETGFASSAHVIEDTIYTGSQEHFYLETQRCLAVPGEDREIILYSSTQSSSEVQEIAARVLGLRSADVTVEVARLGGGFGGKERTPVLYSCLAALACQFTHQPVLLQLQREEDMIASGKRHPFQIRYRIGFDDVGHILAYDVDLSANGGAYVDLSKAILDRAMLHADNAYWLPNVRVTGRACRTNLPPNTAFRGFGAPQGIFAIEHAMTRVAEYLQADPVEIRRRNFYRSGQTTHYGEVVNEECSEELLHRILAHSSYAELKKQNADFNQSCKTHKRGIAIVPVKFGISFTSTFLNQGSSLIWIYTDGTVSVSHGGIEMGQELSTKIQLIVANALGVSISRVKMESSNTKRIGNASPTAASSGCDINGNAARNAALVLRERLSVVACNMLCCEIDDVIFEDDIVCSKHNRDQIRTFEDVVHAAYLQRVDLGAHGFYATPEIVWDASKRSGKPFYYYVFGFGMVQVEVDFRDGSFAMKHVYLLHETGRSIHPEIDRGQIAGAFMQGVGWCTFEELTYDNSTGRYLANSPSTYKIPTVKDQPEKLTIELVEHDRAYASVKQSKGVGEPPLIYGEAVYFAIRDAISAYTNFPVIHLQHPAIPEAILRAAYTQGLE